MGRLLEISARALFFAVAAPVVIRAAWRLRRLERRLEPARIAHQPSATTPHLPESKPSGLDRLCASLRHGELFRLAYLRNPKLLAGTVNCLLPWLPPRGLGPCLKRSLLLQDLWSRCGLRPRLALGVLVEGSERSIHAWATSGAEAEASAYHEIWRG